MLASTIMPEEKNPSTRRTTIVLPALVYELLEQKAASEGRPTANLAAFAVELYIRASYPDEFPSPYSPRK